MMAPPPSVRIFLCTQPTDMRRSFDGLARMVREVIDQEPMSGYLFVFRNRKGHLAKILWWDRSGYCLWYKRLEQGIFHFPDGAGDGDTVEIEAADLALLLEGIDLSGARRRPRFVPASTQRR